MYFLVVQLKNCSPFEFLKDLMRTEIYLQTRHKFYTTTSTNIKTSNNRSTHFSLRLIIIYIKINTNASSDPLPVYLTARLPVYAFISRFWRIYHCDLYFSHIRDNSSWMCDSVSLLSITVRLFVYQDVINKVT